MNRHYKPKRIEAPNAIDFLGGKYLRKEDMPEPRNLTIMDCWSQKVVGSHEQRLIVSFAEIEKPLILNKTNTRRLVKIFGSSDTAKWRGPVLLGNDKGVTYAGRVVGGLRVKRARAVNGESKEIPTFLSEPLPEML